ncbi:DUF4214 domain-containing protein [Marivita hallyeonensis]|uniref:ELWxxDGT repeat-containing protein n=1 Tax=Marivita hallyeonensis TaxID=996342 RepID=A0A1M5Y3V6_9RHOB|nr:DUF4214 domain-containing protein [Marivita hallyeonensis]SHI06183.1 ELWxxDGT repeat-containing protein [Marivita hallyeonensis]
MKDTIIFEAGNFGNKKIYAYDGVAVSELFDISGTLRTAEDMSNGFAFYESSATDPIYELRVYDAQSGSVTTIHTEDALAGSGAPFLTEYQGGVIYKDYAVAGSEPIRFLNEGTTITLVDDSESPFNDRFNGGGHYMDWLGIAGDAIYAAGGNAGNELAIRTGAIGGTVYEDFHVTSSSENGSPRDFVMGDGGVYFVANFPNGGGSGFFAGSSGIVFGDAAGNVNVLTKPDDPGGSPFIGDIEYAGDTLFVSGRRPLSTTDTFNSDTGLFRLDTNAPFALELIASVINGVQITPSQLVDFGENLLFVSNNNLFISDGTGAGTQQLTSNLTGLQTVVSGTSKAFFWGTTAEAGQELWVTDGTVAGTSLVTDLNPGTSGQQGLAITVLDDVAHFQAFADNVAGLFASDGTEIGTELVFAGGRTPVAVTLGQDDQTIRLLNEGLGPLRGVVDAAGVGTIRSRDPGTPNDDTIGSLGRSERLDLRDGLDRFIISSRSDSFTSEVSADSIELSNGIETYVLDSVERITFVDGTLVLDTGAGETAGEAYRIYQAAFSRTPDNDGLEFWLNVMDGGMSIDEVAGFFLTSDEFERTYGTSLSNSDFVNQLYLNVLQRPGDPEGFAFWRDDLNSGDITRAQVLARFAESPENVQNLAPLIDDGYFLI